MKAGKMTHFLRILKPSPSKRIISFLLHASYVLLISGCVTYPPSYSSLTPITGGPLFEYPVFNDEPTGIAVSKEGRIFVTFPRWLENPRYSVAEVHSDGSLSPYPDEEWNRWTADDGRDPGNHFICAQSVYVDGKDFLWILDPANPFSGGVVPGGAKLVKVNLSANEVAQVVLFDGSAVTEKSYLADVCVDESDNVAYISDSGAGAILVVDLSSGSTRRVLAGHPSTLAEEGVVPVIDGRELRYESGKAPRVNVDGLALDPDRKFLYYHALTARTLYRINTAYLKDPLLSDAELGKHVERLEDTGPVNGMLMDRGYNLYLTAPEENAVKRYRVYDGSMLTIAQGDQIQWPHSLGIGPDDNIYFTASQINRLPCFNNGIDERTRQFKYFKTRPGRFNGTKKAVSHGDTETQRLKN